MEDLINERCGWAGTDPLYVRYHDEEWGRPVTDDNKLFEFLLLESAQAGLSWLTILRKREGNRQALLTTILTAAGTNKNSGRQTPKRRSAEINVDFPSSVLSNEINTAQTDKGKKDGCKQTQRHHHK